MLQNVGFSHFAHPKRETFAKRILKFQQALSHIDVKKAKVLEAPRHIVFDCAKPKTFANSNRIFQEAPHNIDLFLSENICFCTGHLWGGFGLSEAIFTLRSSTLLQQ